MDGPSSEALRLVPGAIVLFLFWGVWDVAKTSCLGPFGLRQLSLLLKDRWEA